MDPTVELIEDLTDRALGRRRDAPIALTLAERLEVHRHLNAIVENKAVDAMPVPAGRSKVTKEAVLRSGRFVFARQRAVNDGLIGVVHGLLDEIDSLRLSLEHERRRTAAATVAMEAQLVESSRAQHLRVQELRSSIDRRIGEVDAGVASKLGDVTAQLEANGSAAFDELARRVDDLQSDLRLEQHRRGVLDRELRALRWSTAARRGSAIDAPPPAEPANSSSRNLAELYERFEQFFRPVDHDLRERFESYLPDLEFLTSGGLQLLDIGTGRGDFLTVLRNAGIPARGIDANPEAVERATEAGLDVVLADALAHLARLPNESVGAVTAFHVVEHLEPGDLLDLVDETVRVLAPGGVVIFETPNPTNLAVGAASFYHDPTHRRPVTPDYLSFVMRDRGLEDVSVRFLHPLPEFDVPIEAIDERAGLRGVTNLLADVRWALKGPQDFAVVARGPVGS